MTIEYHHADGMFRCPCGSAVKNVLQHFRTKKHADWLAASPDRAGGMRQQFPKLFMTPHEIREQQEHLDEQRAKREAEEREEREYTAMARNVARYMQEKRAVETISRAWIRYRTNPTTSLGMALVWGMYVDSCADMGCPVPEPDNVCVYEPDADFEHSDSKE